MGQYYRVVLKQNGKTVVYNRDVDGKYTMAKLMEHSWWENPLLKAIGKKLYKKKGRLAWVGDYAEDAELEKIHMKVEDVWGSEDREVKGQGLRSVSFMFDNKYLCNHTKKKYIDLKAYYTECVNDGWCINPLSLLCAIGNGKGGGDYRGIGDNLVGDWAWDEISIEDTSPDDYLLSDITFIE